MCIESRAEDGNSVSGSFDVDIVDEINEDDIELLNISSDGSFTSDPQTTSPRYVHYVVGKTLGLFNLASGLDPNSLYEVDINVLCHFDLDTQIAASFRNVVFRLYDYYIYSNYRVPVVDKTVDIDFDSKLYLYGSDLNRGSNLLMSVVLPHSVASTVSLDYDVSMTVNSIELVSSVDADSYQNGYNSGYSDGLIDGVASVDKEAISNEAYQAGYEAGFADGSDDTLKEDKVLIDTVSGSFDMNGHVLISQTKQYADPEDLFFGYGYASDVVPIFHQYDFDIGKDYLIDFKRLSVRNSEPTYDISSGELVDGYVSILPSFSLSGPGLNMSDLGELIYSPNKTGDTDLSVSVRGDMTMIGEWDDGIDNDYVYIPEHSFALGSMDWVTTVTYEIDVYEIDIVEEIDYLRDQSNKLGDLNNTQQEALDVSKETQATTKGIFESIKEFFGSFFQNLVDSVLGLFVPSADEMSGLFDELNQFFSDRFGFLYAPFDYMIQLLNVFVTSTGDTGITFPGFSIMGYEIWPDMTYDISEDPLVGQIFEYVRMGTGILLAGWFIMYLQDFFKERFSQG